MEPSTLIGIVVTLIGVFVGLVVKGADPVALFTNVAALLIVLVGSIGATVTSHGLDDTKAALASLRRLFSRSPVAPADVVEQLGEMASTARTQGLLALQAAVADVDDPFLKKALTLAVDGTSGEDLEETLASEVRAMKERHKTVAGWWMAAGVFSPTFGIIGAVVGLIAVLSKLDSPEELGHGIGAAFVATFWGIFLANALFLPFANKLKRLSAREVAHREMVIEGVRIIVGGASPRVVVERLSSLVPPALRRAS